MGTVSGSTFKEVSRIMISVVFPLGVSSTTGLGKRGRNLDSLSTRSPTANRPHPAGGQVRAMTGKLRGKPTKLENLPRQSFEPLSGLSPLNPCQQEPLSFLTFSLPLLRLTRNETPFHNISWSAFVESYDRQAGEVLFLGFPFSCQANKKMRLTTFGIHTR